MQLTADIRHLISEVCFLSDRFFRRTWAQVDLDALINNYKVLREAVPKARGLWE